MYGIKYCGHVPEPKPARTDKIIAAHYYPAWKKASAGLHRGFDDIHAFPERTPLIGYYDGDMPEMCDWEIKWALEHGVNCFIYCWYRNKDNAGKPVTVSDLRLGETLHNGFFNARYCNMMDFAIMFETQSRWGASDRQDMLENLMPFWLENYFSRNNYLKIDNRPVVFIYDYQNQLRDGFRDADEQRRTFDDCREMARKWGFDGMIFAVEYRHDALEPIADYRARGYDFSFTYCWGLKKPKPTDEYVIAEQMRKLRLRAEGAADFFCPTASCMWDPSPRFISMPYMYTPEGNPSLWKLQPESFRRLLAEIRDMSDALPEGSVGRRLIMLDNWNEWDEGHYLLPSLEFGFGYLQAIREELTRRDNIPDYRLPVQLGTPPVNATWDEPDLSGWKNENF